MLAAEPLLTGITSRGLPRAWHAEQGGGDGGVDACICKCNCAWAIVPTTCACNASCACLPQLVATCPGTASCLDSNRAAPGQPPPPRIQLPSYQVASRQLRLEHKLHYTKLHHANCRIQYKFHHTKCITPSAASNASSITPSASCQLQTPQHTISITPIHCKRPGPRC